MSKWIVEWQNEIDTGDSPLDVVKDCLKDIQNNETLCFTITEIATGRRWSVDLEEDDENATMEII